MFSGCVSEAVVELPLDTDTDTDTDLNQNVRASMEIKGTADKQNAHTQPQKCGKRDTQKALVDRSAIMNVVSASQPLFACRSAQTW